MPDLILAGDALAVALPLAGNLTGTASFTVSEDNTASGGGVVTAGPFPATLTPRTDGLTTDLTGSVYPVPPGLVAGTISLTVTLDGTVYAPLTATLVGPPLPLPSSLLSVAAWRARLRRLVRDEALVPDASDGTVDPSLLTVLSDDALDDALRAALPLLSVYRPVEKPLPPLTLTAGIALYPLPDDFLDPVEETWPWLNSCGYDHLPGSRYQRLRQQALSGIALPIAGTYGGRAWGGGGYFGAFGSLYASLSGGPPVAYTANGFLSEGFGTGLSSRPQIEFQEPSVAVPVPALVFSAAPSLTCGPLTTLRYQAAHTVQRLAATTDGTAWQAGDYAGGYLSTTVPLGADFSDNTDVLSFGAGSDLVNLSLLYAQWYTLSEIITSLAQSDGDRYAFYEHKTGLGRRDIQRLADTALAQFQQRTLKRVYGERY